jgi:hypothetical protein
MVASSAVHGFDLTLTLTGGLTGALVFGYLRVPTRTKPNNTGEFIPTRPRI